jgi:hypothetical protein
LEASRDSIEIIGIALLLVTFGCTEILLGLKNLIVWCKNQIVCGRRKSEKVGPATMQEIKAENPTPDEDPVFVG